MLQFTSDRYEHERREQMYRDMYEARQRDNFNQLIMIASLIAGLVFGVAILRYLGY